FRSVPLFFCEYIALGNTSFERQKSYRVLFDNYVERYDFLKEIIVLKQNPLKIWSAGCSTGEEPITLAMIMQEKSKIYSIFGSDISTKVINKAKKAIFTTDKTKDIPDNLLKKYFNKKTEDKKITYKAKEILTKNIKYAQINFMSSNYGISNVFDIIFFRNVLIYFNIETQKEILHKILKHLKPGGHLFIGHSEAIYEHSMPIKNVNPSVYLKDK
ncbi:MAG: CheR family methyltransferase, partial [Bacteroidota bacterium]|nr:CheR family methyltransferase [Bacteroidota bacterium]